TNGTVNNVGKTKVNGTVASDGGSTLTLNYKDGSKNIDVTPETVIVTYVPGSKEELKAGARIYIPAAIRQPDGSLTAARVNGGRGLAPPMGELLRKTVGLTACRPRRRVRRTACTNIEDAGGGRHLPHAAKQPVLTADGKLCFALLLNRPATLVAAREAVNLGAMVGQPCQKMREIFQLFGDDVDNARFFLDESANRQVTRAQHNRTQ